MNSQQATRSSEQPLGGTSGDWSYRLLRYHLPLALVSVAAILLWTSLSLFRQSGGMAAMQHGPAQATDQVAQGAGHQMQTPPQAAQAAGHTMPAGAARAAGHAMPAQAAQAAPAAQATDDMHTGRGAMAGMRIDAFMGLDRGFMARFTTASGYVALGLLAFTLLVGPANLLLRRRNPVSSYLRRDAGTWTAIVSVVHVIAGITVHGNPVQPLDQRILRYFFAPDGSLLTDSFGLGNWTGLVATVIVLGLLALSSDFALRKLKARPWKWLQRLNYALFALVVAHAMYYAAFGGSLLRAGSPSTVLLVPTVTAVFVAQAAGIWLWRQRYVRVVS